MGKIGGKKLQKREKKKGKMEKKWGKNGEENRVKLKNGEK